MQLGLLHVIIVAVTDGEIRIPLYFSFKFPRLRNRIQFIHFYQHLNDVFSFSNTFITTIFPISINQWKGQSSWYLRLPFKSRKLLHK